MERLTVSLDDELAGKLELLHQSSGESKANVVRRALRDHLRKDKQAHGRPTEQDLRVWSQLLAHREHVILDVAHLRLLMQQAMDAPDTFWQELHEIGIEHGRQYRDKGMGRVQDMLHVMEAANWLLVSPESDRSWTLVLTDVTSKPFVRVFLEGFYLEHPVKVDIVEERLKLRVVSHPGPAPSRHRAPGHA